jgi:regulatory protein
MTAEIHTKNSFRHALNSAVRLLARRDHTRYEIQQKLKLRRFNRGVINRVLTECERLNYIDDERTARLFIEQLVRRGFGFRRIGLELRKKGLKGERFDAILNQSRSQFDEYEIAAQVLQKKVKGLKDQEDPQKRRNRLYRFLQYRGFSEQTIAKALSKGDFSPVGKEPA